MRLDELLGNPNAGVFTKTPKFLPVYGNYCGPGNRGGEPIDIIDRACMMHDMCYWYQHRHDEKCDERFIKELYRILDQETLTPKQKMYVWAMIKFFEIKKNKTK